jgi:SAM-dependent methyltransferase
VGYYEDHLLPKLVDRFCGAPSFDPLRKKAAEGLAGTILEIGFAGGPNLSCYPPEVNKVLAVEPSEEARHLATKRIAQSNVAVDFVGLDGQSIQLPDDYCDGALSTFTLCTVPDAEAALGEIKRIVRPGGALHVLEHGLAPDGSTQTWQRRLNGLQQRCCGGCQLVRDVPALLVDAGFDVVQVDQRYVKGPKPWCYFTMAVAVVPE